MAVSSTSANVWETQERRQLSVQHLQIVLIATQNLDVLIFFKKNVFPDVRSEIHLSDITLFLPDLQNLSGLTKNIYSGLGKLQIWTFFTQWWQLESLPDHVCVRGLEFISLWAYRSLVSVLKIRLLRLLYNFISILGIVVKIVMSKQR